MNDQYLHEETKNTWISIYKDKNTDIIKSYNNKHVTYSINLDMEIDEIIENNNMSTNKGDN